MELFTPCEVRCYSGSKLCSSNCAWRLDVEAPIACMSDGEKERERESSVMHVPGDEARTCHLPAYLCHNIMDAHVIDGFFAAVTRLARS